MSGVLHSINVSNGGVPKLPRHTAAVRTSGVEGDRQRDLRYHGGPTRAVSLYSLELIRALRAEGHSIDVGCLGENFTLTGVPWEKMVPGATLEVGAVGLELTAYAAPCSNLVAYFTAGKFMRVAQKVHPGWSRLYARVLREGTVRTGDAVRLP
ncbi:MAG: MOSC domain-containing protein [Betaproteobacteria bacterium]|nr:MAG: MOSC domain-containing protein [Betaproteobacteria bacterium]